MDYNKISPLDPKVVNKVTETIEEKYGKMAQTRGDKYNFLGMNIKFKDKKVKSA